MRCSAAFDRLDHRVHQLRHFARRCHDADFLGVKQPSRRIVLGGPEVGYRAGDVLERYPFVDAVIGGEYGFFRSFDDCRTIQRINTAQQMFGRIHSIDGDKRVFGRFYLATGSSGLLLGEPEE